MANEAEKFVLFLTGETEGGGDARHGSADEMVQVAVGRRRQFQRAEANIIKSLQAKEGN